MKIHNILWLVAILSATAVLVFAVLYKLIKKKELLDPKYQILIAFVQSSQLFFIPIFLSLHTFFGCKNFYSKHSFSEYIKNIVLSVLILSAVFLISPTGLILVKNNTSSPVVENIFSILTLVSLFVIGQFGVSGLTSRGARHKNLGPMFYDKKCKP
jgi:hypothetical protein